MCIRDRDIIADTNGNDEDVTWCLEDGTNIGSGNPLEDFNPGMDTITVIAKIIDMFGCMANDTIVLVPDQDPDSCLESVIITGPDPGVICVDEEFELCLTMDDDCDIENFIFDWGPNDCIVSGNGTPKVVVSATESKTITVNVTDIALGIDSTFIFDIELSDQQVEIDIVNNGTELCSDSLNLSISNAIIDSDYVWSTDSDFINILGTGTSYIGVGGDLFTGTIYVQTTNNTNPCLNGIDSIMIDNGIINLSFGRPFIICPGDTSNFEVINNNPNQTITYEWKGGNGELIEGGDTNNPLIGIDVNTTEDIFYILCTSNDLGCTSVDTINFEIRENETLDPFIYEPDSCGSLTINFDDVPNGLGDNASWDFGDGNTATGSIVSNTYDTPGIYTVTLSDSSSVCPKDAIMMEINVANLSIEILGSLNDTIFYLSLIHI